MPGMSHALPACIAVLAFNAVAAHADLKLVQKTTMGGDLAKAGSERAQKMGTSSVGDTTTTTYLKGKRARSESGGRVTIFDGARTLLLNPNKKTYQAIPTTQEAMANPMLALMDMKADVSVKAGGKTKVIAGKTAKNYVLLMTMQIGLKSGTLPKKNEGTEPTMPKIPPITSTTEIWAAEFAGIASNAKLLAQGFSMLPGMKDLPQKLSAVKGIGLESTMTQNMMGRTLVVTLKTVSISEAALEDSLFIAPKGWKQVPYEAPAMPPGLRFPGGER